MNQADTYRARLWDERDAGTERPGERFGELQALVDEEPADEMLYLDFKSGSFLFRDGRLDRDNVKAILSKAVSAFANASGGVLIWGVTDWEKARAKKPKLESFPAAQAEELHRALKRVQQGATQPRPPDVRHTVIPGRKGRKRYAYVATYIGKNEGPPLQARYGDHMGRFFRRRSDGSGIMSCDEIADMFGRRPHPRLELDLAYERGQRKEDQFAFIVVVRLRNDGRGLAHYPALFLGFGPQGAYTAHPLPQIPGEPQGVPRVMPRSARHRFCYAGGTDHVIYPGTVLPFMRIASQARVGLSVDSTVIESLQVPTLRLEAQIHAADMAPRKVKLNVKAEEIATGLRLPKRG